MRLSILFLFFFTAVVSAQDPIVPKDAKLEKLFTGIMLTEGVAVAPDGQVYFSDITFSHQSTLENGQIHAGHIWRFDPTTGKTSIFRSPSGMSNGIKFDAHGDMIVCEGADYGGRRVTRTDMKTGMSYIVAGMYEGRKLNSPNDVTIDLKGRLYFSDPRYLGHETIDQPVMGVYRIDPDGSITRIISDAGKPNGVCISPDQKTLYVVSNANGATGFERLGTADDAKGPVAIAAPLRKGHMALMAYDLDKNGAATYRETLVDYSPEDGPDGLVVDSAGNLIVAERSEKRPGIAIYAPEGKELGFIETPTPTNVGFGRGEDANLLYITAGAELYRIRLNTTGYQLPAAKQKRK
ncbi:MAG: SMP-30/gluconolactonase/LRE family protein [Planctomycetota bacterium]|nr:SMP-30/gluconolactonase/LRE family protein [Planctomycetota bacterium]